MSDDISPDDVLAATQGVRARTIALLRSVDAEQLARIVPTCPAWTVKDLAAHMFGVGDDLLAGRLEGIGSAAWTDAQVERMREIPIDGLLDQWEASAAAFDQLVPHIPAPSNLQLVMDMATHEHDIRLALGVPGAQDDPSLAVGAAYLLGGLRRGDPDLAARIDGAGLSDFELLRTLTGRRSMAQMEAAGIPADGVARMLEPSPMTIVADDLVEAQA